MEAHDKPLSPADSLALIEAFISRTKTNLKAVSFDLLLWGVLVSLASLLNYYLMTVVKYEKSYLPWPILMIGGSIVTTVYHATNKEQKQMRTFSDSFLMWLFISAGFVYFVMAFLCVYQNISPLPFMLAITSIVIFVTGAVLKFRPLIGGGIIFVLAALAAVFLNYPNQLLLTFGVVLTGYLLPGFLLKTGKKSAENV